MKAIERLNIGSLLLKAKRCVVLRRRHVVDAGAPSKDRLGRQAPSKSDARLNICPVGRITARGPAVNAGEPEAAHDGGGRGRISAVRIVWMSRIVLRRKRLPVLDDAIAVWIDAGEIEARVHFVVAFFPRDLDVVADPPVNCEMGSDFPVVLNIAGIVGSRPIECRIIIYTASVAGGIAEEKIGYGASVELPLTFIGELLRPKLVKIELAVVLTGIVGAVRDIDEFETRMNRVFPVSHGDAGSKIVLVVGIEFKGVRVSKPEQLRIGRHFDDRRDIFGGGGSAEILRHSQFIRGEVVIRVARKVRSKAAERTADIQYGGGREHVSPVGDIGLEAARRVDVAGARGSWKPCRVSEFGAVLE